MARLCSLRLLGSGLARADGCPVAPPRSGLSIKPPCNPKSVCRCISIAILLRTGSPNFKLHGIYIPGIYQVYTWYRPYIYDDIPQKIQMSYDRYILGIYLLCGECRIPGIYYVYTCHIACSSSILNEYYPLRDYSNS